MGEPQQLSGGELNAALTSEVVRIHTANLGRGPAKSDSLPSERLGLGRSRYSVHGEAEARCGTGRLDDHVFCSGLDLRQPRRPR